MLYLQNFCTFPQNGSKCYRNETSHSDSTHSNEIISNFNISLNNTESLTDKIIILLLDDYGQIVTTQNALGQLNKSQIQLLNFNEKQNLYFLSDYNLTTSNILSRLQVFTANEGIMIITNFVVDFTPGF